MPSQKRAESRLHVHVNIIEMSRFVHRKTTVPVADLAHGFAARK
jgi:hypothetical protein